MDSKRLDTIVRSLKHNGFKFESNDKLYYSK